jgi:glucose/arabinose dehydrogenase
MASPEQPARALALDATGRLYVSAPDGPGAAASTRVLRFAPSPLLPPAGGFPAEGAEVFAAGLDGPVALAFDAAGQLWAAGLPGAARHWP